MSATEIIEKMKALPLNERKPVLKELMDEFEEEVDTRLYDERIQEPDGPTLAELGVAQPKAP